MADQTREQRRCRYWLDRARARAAALDRLNPGEGERLRHAIAEAIAGIVRDAEGNRQSAIGSPETAPVPGATRADPRVGARPRA